MTTTVEANDDSIVVEDIPEGEDEPEDDIVSVSRGDRHRQPAQRITF